MVGVDFERTAFQALADEMGASLTFAALQALVQGARRATQMPQLHGTIREQVAQVLDVAVAGRWLAELLHVVVDAPADHPAPLVDACRLALGRWDAALRRLTLHSLERPQDALMLSQRRPFVDRRQQRDELDELLGTDGRRVMVVRGEAASGKTHLSHFVGHLAGARGHRWYPIDFEDVRPADERELLGAREAMMKIAGDLGLETAGFSSDRDAQPARQAEKMCDEFIRLMRVGALAGAAGAAAAAPGRLSVIVLDGLNRPHVGPGALELVDRLILAVWRGALADVCLVLLGLDAPVPAKAALDVSEQHLLPLGREDLREYVSAVAGRLGRGLGDSELDAIVSSLVDGVPVPYGHAGMIRIRRNLDRLPKLLQEV